VLIKQGRHSEIPHDFIGLQEFDVAWRIHHDDGIKHGGKTLDEEGIFPLMVCEDAVSTGCGRSGDGMH